MSLGTDKIAAQTIVDVAVEAASRLEEAREAALLVLEKAKQLETNSELNIKRIREISESLSDPELPIHVLDEMPDGILLIDTSMTIRLINKETERLFGYSRRELDGQQLNTLVPQDCQATHTLHVNKFSENPISRKMGTGLDIRGVRKDKSEVSLDISLTTILVLKSTFILAIVREKQIDE
jgi:PAS domain S-box-containing protein